MSATGERLWRALDERELDAWVAAEFPAALPLLGEPGRREVLRAMAASLALAGLGGCGEGAVEALPYVEQPPEIVPGVARFFATAIVFEGYAQPVLAETHEGRPTKLEGNPQHPASGGATDAFTQAAILQLYDPDRSAAPLRDGRPASWTEVERAMFELAGTLDGRHGAGFRILTGDVTSPTMIRQLEALRCRWPEMSVHGFEPIGDGWRRAGLRAAFGRELDLQLALAEAAAIVTLDDDVLGPGPAQVAHVRGWAAARRAGSARIFAAECTPGLTGTAAVARLAAAPSRIPVLASALARRCGVAADELAPSPRESAWIDAAFRRSAHASLPRSTRSSTASTKHSAMPERPSATSSRSPIGPSPSSGSRRRSARARSRRCSCSAPIPSTPRPAGSASPNASPACRRCSMPGFTSTRRARAPNGTCRSRTISRAGAMRARSMGRRRSSSR
jgi:molybdopterin-containing oxidoreductase family iron-sulfur binding subunit